MAAAPMATANTDERTGAWPRPGSSPMRIAEHRGGTDRPARAGEAGPRACGDGNGREPVPEGPEWPGPAVTSAEGGQAPPTTTTSRSSSAPGASVRSLGRRRSACGSTPRGRRVSPPRRPARRSRHRGAALRRTRSRRDQPSAARLTSVAAASPRYRTRLGPEDEDRGRRRPARPPARGRWRRTGGRRRPARRIRWPGPTTTSNRGAPRRRTAARPDVTPVFEAHAEEAGFERRRTRPAWSANAGRSANAGVVWRVWT